MLVKYVSIDGILQVFVFFRFVDIIVITVRDRFWNVGQANCILKYFENMMIDHSDSTIFLKMADFIGKIHASALH
jgi:phosphate starvation-inducible membrane PsiE